MSDLDTLTWWNIDLMLAISATGSLLNLSKTPTSELIRSGPCNNSELRDVPWYNAPQSYTTLSVFSLDGVPHDVEYTRFFPELPPFPAAGQALRIPE